MMTIYGTTPQVVVNLILNGVRSGRYRAIKDETYGRTVNRIKAIQIRYSSILNRNWTFDHNKARFQENASKLRPVVLPKRTLKETPSDTVKSVDRTHRSDSSSPSPTGFAVLVPFCTINDIPCVLFTLRSSQLTKHRGEISFPGGRAEQDDKSITTTALRETEEEIGIRPSQVDVWSVLPNLPTRDRGGVLTPIVGHLGAVEKLEFIPNASEVEQIFLCSLSHLCSPVNRGYTSFRSQPPLKIPVFRTGKTVDWKYQPSIWGMTAMILDSVLTCLLPELYKRNFHFVTHSLKVRPKT